MDFTTIVAETPYDEMGAEFAKIFGSWCNETELTQDSRFFTLALNLFEKRLALAKRYNTFFATQVTEKGERMELWKERVIGVGNTPAYSFATPNLQRTERFFKWCQLVDEKANAKRQWDVAYAPRPNLPPHGTPFESIAVWAHRYEPRFSARLDGAFECRRMYYAENFYLIEHPRSRWMKQIFNECETFWRIALSKDMPLDSRIYSLASFEFLWFWANPFMRSGALTGDALSLVMQKKIGVKIRSGFYHQDCEALLMPFNDYVEKRFADMTFGFKEKFPMN